MTQKISLTWSYLRSTTPTSKILLFIRKFHFPPIPDPQKLYWNISSDAFFFWHPFTLWVAWITGICNSIVVDHKFQYQNEKSVLWSSICLGENISKLSKEFPSLQSRQRESLPEEVPKSDWNQESSWVWTKQRDEFVTLWGIHQPPASHIHLATGQSEPGIVVMLNISWLLLGILTALIDCIVGENIQTFYRTYHQENISSLILFDIIK